MLPIAVMPFIINYIRIKLKLNILHVKMLIVNFLNNFHMGNATILFVFLFLKCEVCLSHSVGPMSQNLFLVMVQSAI